MRIPAEINPETYEKINKLVEEGRYSGLNQFIRVAIQNQLDLEESKLDNEVAQTQLEFQQEAPLTQIEPDHKEVDTGFQWEYKIPDAPPVRDSFQMDRSNQLLFSQYYRFLPLKFVMCELAKETSKADSPIEIDEFREHIQEACEPIRDKLVAWEKENDIKKQDKKSTGFPKTDTKNPERSINRFLNHFVGHIQKTKGEPSGFGHELGLVSIKKESDREDWTVCLTPRGATFLEYKNPLLAHGPAEPTLSDEEQEFLISHIREDLDLEYEFMQYIVDTLAGVDGTYTSCMEEFDEFLSSERVFGEDVSENRVRSHTAGTISRMVDLDLLSRGKRRGHYNVERHPSQIEAPTGFTTESFVS